ncbi:MAG TPA: flagellar hook-basal body complex protein FliE [Verrucomicrobiae bacterium]|nr:flagellar hook-basal body complex protein FliE [Verrucomicrobiae bacterium]
MANTIQGLPVPNLGASTTRATSGAGGQSDFFEALQGAMDQVEQLHQDEQGKVAGMLDGSGEDVHSAMIAVEKAGLAFEMMVQVRNKIVQAYQTVSQMNF